MNYVIENDFEKVVAVVDGKDGAIKYMEKKVRELTRQHHTSGHLWWTNEGKLLVMTLDNGTQWTARKQYVWEDLSEYL